MNRKLFAAPMLSIALAAGTLAGGAAIVAPTAALADRCPPGLAKKHNGCQPPGHAWKSDRHHDDHYVRRDYDYRRGERESYHDGYRQGYREAQRDDYYDRDRRSSSDLDGAVRLLNGILN